MPQEASGATTPQTKELAGPPAPPTLQEALEQVLTLNEELTGNLEQYVLKLDSRTNDHAGRLVAETRTRSGTDEKMLNALDHTVGQLGTVSLVAHLSLLANIVLAVAVVNLYRRLKK